MWPSSSARTWAVLAGGLLLLSGPARAQTCPNTCLRIHETALDEMMRAFGTIQDARRVETRFLGILICDDDAETTVDDFRFDITPTGITVTAEAETQYCGLTVRTPVTATAEVTLDASEQNLIVSIDPDPVQPTLVIPVMSLSVTAPIPPIELAPELRLDPIPIGSVPIEVRTGPLTRTQWLVGRSRQVVYGPDVLEIRGELQRWR